jgi:hypothetical protein
MSGEPYVKLDGRDGRPVCPGCGDAILEPFLIPARDPYPLPYTHRRGPGQPSCRILVVVRPDGTIKAQEIPHDVSYEAALRRCR